jgi:sulfite oxidase
MRTKIKEVDGINWKDGAVCNCIWSGPLLCDVLSKVGVTSGGVDTQVAFSCHAMDCEDDKYYGGSITLSRCMDPKRKVILALNVCFFYPNDD